jgi:hypothetical protein
MGKTKLKLSLRINRLLFALGSVEFRAAGFLSTSKSRVCWDPLQRLGVYDE